MNVEYPEGLWNYNSRQKIQEKLGLRWFTQLTGNIKNMGNV
jgi:hypothetical protein